MMLGLFTRPMAITTPGMFLSHPGMEMLASYHWPFMTVSMLSAMISRLCSENRIPLVPMLIPSDTPTVLNRNGTSPALATDSLIGLERSIKCMLHGLPSYHTDEMPTWALFMSASFRPVAYSIAWEAPCDLGWVMWAETALSFSSAFRADVVDRCCLFSLCLWVVSVLFFFCFLCFFC